MPELSQVLSVLKEMAPLSLAESWDNVGLLVEPVVHKPVGCVLFTNDLTEDVLDEAETIQADLIVSYHPPVFAPLKRITLDSWKSRIVSRCLSQGISVYSPHTSWDAVENGLTDWLLSTFDGTVSPIHPLSISPEFSHLAVFTSYASNNKPLDEKKFTAVLENQIDNKDFRILTFSASQLQLLCNLNVLSSLDAIANSLGAHVLVTKSESFPSQAIAGGGRLCRFKNELTVGNAIEKIKSHLGVKNLMLALARGSTMESTIKSAAAVAGSGASVLRGVKADIYLTGEMSHHDILDAVHNNVTVILANHSNTERGYLQVFAAKLLIKLPELKIHVSTVDKDPLTFV